MKILSIDQATKTVILQSDREELAKLLGFRSWWDLERTGHKPGTGSTIPIGAVAEASALIRNERNRLEQLRAEYSKRLEEVDRLIAVVEARPTPPVEKEEGSEG